MGAVEAHTSAQREHASTWVVQIRVPESLEEIIGYQVKAEDKLSMHTMRFVGGGHFSVSYLDGRPTGYEGAGVRFTRWDAETIEVSAHPAAC